MKHATILVVLGVLLATAGPGAAGVDRYAVGNVHMRSGLGTAHPVIGTVQAGDAVTVHGCMRGWCEASWGGRRGWVYGPYLQYAPLKQRVRGDRRRPSGSRPLVQDRDRNPSRDQTLFGHDQTLFGHDTSLFPDR
jgi:uncharacterized protein YraI